MRIFITRLYRPPDLKVYDQPFRPSFVILVRLLGWNPSGIILVVHIGKPNLTDSGGSASKGGSRITPTKETAGRADRKRAQLKRSTISAQKMANDRSNKGLFTTHTQMPRLHKFDISLISDDRRIIHKAIHLFKRNPS